MIHIGDDAKGNRVELPIHHTGVFGQTGVGKTRLLKYMIAQAKEQGYRVLIFDSKVTGAEFDDIESVEPFYIEQSTDPDVYRSLIEGMRTKGRANMERFRGGFIEVAADARNFGEIGSRLEDKLADNRIRGFTRSMYQEILYDHRKLMKLLGKEKFAPMLELSFYDRVTRVPTHRLPNLALQGLVVRSIVEEVLRKYSKLIVLVDEAPNFVNQKKYNPAKDALQQLDAQGRSKAIFGWYSGQTITGFDKANMKNLWYWIMGREMERNEAKDVFDTQTTKALSVDQIKRMKVREFIVSTPDGAQVVTVPKLSDAQDLIPSEWEIRGDTLVIGGPLKPRSDVIKKALQSGGSDVRGQDRNTATSSLGLEVKQKAAPPPDTLEPLDVKTIRVKGVVIEKPKTSSVWKPEEPKPVTKTLAAFTLKITQLECTDPRGWIAYLVKKHGSLRQSEMIAKAADYGKVLHKGDVSETVNEMVSQGSLWGPDINHRYRFPAEEFSVEVVAA